MTHQRWPSRGGGVACSAVLLVGALLAALRVLLQFVLQLHAGITKRSPRLSTAQAMRAFLAAMAMTALQ